jgi:hypothetical protein
MNIKVTCMIYLNHCASSSRLTVSPFLAQTFASIQILAVGAEPALSRFTINGAVLSQIKCAPPSAFSISMHSSGVCINVPFWSPFETLIGSASPGAVYYLLTCYPCHSDGCCCRAWRSGGCHLWIWEPSLRISLQGPGEVANYPSDDRALMCKPMH